MPGASGTRNAHAIASASGESGGAGTFFREHDLSPCTACGFDGNDRSHVAK